MLLLSLLLLISVGDYLLCRCLDELLCRYANDLLCRCLEVLLCNLLVVNFVFFQRCVNCLAVLFIDVDFFDTFN